MQPIIDAAVNLLQPVIQPVMEFLRAVWDVILLFC